MKFRNIPEDKKLELESISVFVDHVVKIFELEEHLSAPYDELVEMIEFCLPIGAEENFDVAVHVSDLEKVLHQYYGVRGVYMADADKGHVNLLYKLILKEFYEFYEIPYTPKDVDVPSKQFFELSADEKQDILDWSGYIPDDVYGEYRRHYASSKYKDFVDRTIKKFNLSEWFDEHSYDEIFDTIASPLEDPEYEDDIGLKIHYVEDRLYTLANKKAIFIPYPSGEMNRTFYLLLEEYYDFYDIPYTDEDINIPNSWMIDGHAVHREYIKEVME